MEYLLLRCPNCQHKTCNRTINSIPAISRPIEYVSQSHSHTLVAFVRKERLKIIIEIVSRFSAALLGINNNHIVSSSAAPHKNRKKKNEILQHINLPIVFLFVRIKFNNYNKRESNAVVLLRPHSEDVLMINIDILIVHWRFIWMHKME